MINTMEKRICFATIHGNRWRVNEAEIRRTVGMARTGNDNILSNVMIQGTNYKSNKFTIKKKRELIYS